MSTEHPDIIFTTPDVIAGLWETALENLVAAQKLQLQHSQQQMDKLETQEMALGELSRRLDEIERRIEAAEGRP